MAVLDYATLQSQISELARVIEQLSALAKQERWDDLLLAWPDYEAVAQQLADIPWRSLTAAECAMVQSQLLAIQAAHEQLMAATIVWRAELQEILQNTVQSRKLTDTYR